MMKIKMVLIVFICYSFSGALVISYYVHIYYYLSVSTRTRAYFTVWPAKVQQISIPALPFNLGDIINNFLTNLVFSVLTVL